ncbi:MAG: nitrile hydratase subunit beta [Geminicoccaceae bacterium]|mgnify:CR=1 FL=1|nr:nitrile hydratase subunit beta [Geminicoccaceae bacterium]
MNGGQDLGGMMGFGPVRPEPGEPVFHSQWERRVFALTGAMARPGGWNIDQSRFARESLDPGRYLTSTYYEIWLAGLERLLAERGLVTADELAAGRPLGEPLPVPAILEAAAVEPTLAKGASTSRPADRPPRFAVGAPVRARLLNPEGHTRLPRYVRGRPGVVTADHGFNVLPDINATGRGESPERLYTVRFAARDLWGDDADPTASVSVDAWERYLEPAGDGA